MRQLLFRFKRFHHVISGIIVRNDVESRRKAHKAVHMISVAMSKDDFGDLIGCDLSDFRKHLFRSFFGHLSVDDDNLFVGDKETGIGPGPAFDLKDVSLDVLNGNWRRRLPLWRSLLLRWSQNNEAARDEAERHAKGPNVHRRFLSDCSSR